MPAASELDIDGRKVRVTNLHKVLYPESGFTKAQVIDYYARIADVLLPHLQKRPVTLKRYPDGVSAEGPFDQALENENVPLGLVLRKKLP